MIKSMRARNRAFALSSTLLCLLLTLVGAWMILKCHRFARLLYQYKISMPAAGYKIIRAYLPLALFVLVCCVAVPRTRLLALFIATATAAAGCALHVGLFVRGASGCCGPRVSGAVVTGGLLVSIGMLVLAMLSVVWGSVEQHRARGAMQSIVLLTLALAGMSGCGRQQPVAAAPAAAKPQLASITNAAHTTKVMLVAAAPPSGAGALTDTILKKVDDFSTALGAQYARFSYDTNRFLTAAHTNCLSRLSDDEFIDFLSDFARACSLRGIRAGEFDLVYPIVRDRLSSLDAVGNLESYHNIGNAFLALAFEANDIRASAIAEAWLRMTKQSAYQTGDPGYMTDAMAFTVGFVLIKKEGPLRAGYLKAIYPIIRGIAHDEHLAAMNLKKHIIAYSVTAELEEVIDPISALKSYITVRDLIMTETGENKEKHSALLILVQDNIERLNNALGGGAP